MPARNLPRPPMVFIRVRQGRTAAPSAGRVALPPGEDYMALPGILEYTPVNLASVFLPGSG